MEFYCSVCDYTSDLKSHVKRHTTRKVQCGENPQILTRKVDIECEYCGKGYTTKANLKRHLKNCKVLKSNQESEINELKTKLAIAEAKLEVKGNTITNNNTVNINIQVNGYNDTDFSKLTDKHFNKVLNKMLMSVPQLIEYTHFNKNQPQNHNIYISNQKGKYAMVYNGSNWEIKDQNQTVDKLITDHEYELEQWVEGKCEEHPIVMEKFQKYLKIKEKDGAEEAMKEEVRMMLYNKRNLIKN